MQPISRTIREQVTERIRDQVVSGALAPGQPLRETEFAARFGVSRGPVRDAFLSLAQEGLLSYEPHRGVTVNSPPRPEYRPLITSLRLSIEIWIAKAGVKSLDDDAMAELELSLETLADACAKEDATAVARCDLAFHETLLVACGGSDLLPVWRWLCSQMLMAYGRLETFADVHAEHVAILDAVRSKKTSRVARALTDNIR